MVGMVYATGRIMNTDPAQVLVIDGGEFMLDQRLLRVRFCVGNDP
jgi:hypothetical protein